MNRLNILLALLMPMSLFAEAKLPSEYVWEKPAGINRIERGVSLTVKMSDVKDGFQFQQLACHPDENLLNGGCVAVYGFKLQGSMPLNTSDSPLSRWSCDYNSDLSTALTLDGAKPAAVLPADQLQGTMYIVLTCEKAERHDPKLNP